MAEDALTPGPHIWVLAGPTVGYWYHRYRCERCGKEVTMGPADDFPTDPCPEVAFQGAMGR